MSEPTNQPGGDEFPPTKRLFWNPISLTITVGAIVLLILAVIILWIFMNLEGPMDVHASSSFIGACFFVLLFVVLVGLIIFGVLAKSCKKEPHRGHEQLNADKSDDKSKEKEKKPSSGKFKVWFWKLIKLNLVILFFLGLYYGGKWLRSPGEKAFFDNISMPTVRTAGLPVCKDAWQQEAAAVGNHAGEDGISYFDVQPTNGCFEAWIYPPINWAGWDKEFVPGGDECLAWFWFYGEERPRGPYAPTDLPDFGNVTPRWRISTNCTIRYFRTR